MCRGMFSISQVKTFTPLSRLIGYSTRVGGSLTHMGDKYSYPYSPFTHSAQLPWVGHQEACGWIREMGILSVTSYSGSVTIASMSFTSHLPMPGCGRFQMERQLLTRCCIDQTMHNAPIWYEGGLGGGHSPLSAPVDATVRLTRLPAITDHHGKGWLTRRRGRRKGWMSTESPVRVYWRNCVRLPSPSVG
jgi:hypothetical protein